MGERVVDGGLEEGGGEGAGQGGVSGRRGGGAAVVATEAVIWPAISKATKVAAPSCGTR